MNESTALLAIYLNDHLAGATAGVGFADRLAKAYRSRPDGEWISELSREIRQDRTALLTVMDELDIPVRHYKVAAARVAELAGRAKLNGKLVSRSPLSDVIEIEALRLGVEGKAAGWRTLRTRAATDDRLDGDWLDGLIDSARQQSELLEELRIRAADAAFGKDRASPGRSG